MKSIADQIYEYRDFFARRTEEEIKSYQHVLEKFTNDYILQNIDITHTDYFDYNKNKSCYEVVFEIEGQTLGGVGNRKCTRDSKVRYSSVKKNIDRKDYISDVFFLIKEWREKTYRKIDLCNESLNRNISFPNTKFKKYKFEGYEVIYSSMETDSYYDTSDGHGIHILKKNGVLFFNKGIVTHKKVYFKRKNIKEIKFISQVVNEYYYKYFNSLKEHEKKIIGACLSNTRN